MYIMHEPITVGEDYSLQIPEEAVKILDIKPGQKYIVTKVEDGLIEFKFIYE